MLRTWLKTVLAVTLTWMSIGAGVAEPTEPFSFESIKSLEDMRSFVRARFPLGSGRSELQRVFIVEGHGTLKVRPDDVAVEKYIYDIDLCHYYIWRWNVSADFDADGRLRQAYVNGEPALDGGTPKRIVSKVAEDGKKASIYRAQRPRPEAYKGETSLSFLLFDRDSDPRTTNDQAAAGAGPSRPDPASMGTMTTYFDVDPWRSIFDSDAADSIAFYKGDCAVADAFYEHHRRATQASAPR